MADGMRNSPKREANRLSNMLRMVLGEGRFPVDVEALALEVSSNNEDPIERIVGNNLPGFEGMLRPHKRRPVWHIIYNDNPRYRGRVRFTIAHEFGHYQLHRWSLREGNVLEGALKADCGFECKPLRSNTWCDAERQREEEADMFASFLLMPLDDYRRQVGDQEMTADLLRHITDRYGVSLTAACRKWIDFTEKRAAMIVARDGFALWGRASKPAFESGVFVRSGMPLPDEALAITGSDETGFTSDTPVTRPEGVWSFSRGSEPVRELAMISEFLDISITILQFYADSMSADVEEEEPSDVLDMLRTGWQVHPGGGRC